VATAQARAPSSMDYSKWDALTVDDEHESSFSRDATRDPASKRGSNGEWPVGWRDAARKRVEAAKAAGTTAAPLDDLFTLENNASTEDILRKMRALHAHDKQALVDSLENGPGRDLLQMAQGREKEVLAEAYHNMEAHEAQPTTRSAAPTQDAATAISETLKALKLVGQRVVLKGLSSRPELNGQAGVCEKYVPEKKRFAVRLDGVSADTPPLALKTDCLALETGATDGDARDPYGVGSLTPDARAAVEAQLLAGLTGTNAIKA